MIHTKSPIEPHYQRWINGRFPSKTLNGEAMRITAAKYLNNPDGRLLMAISMVSPHTKQLERAENDLINGHDYNILLNNIQGNIIEIEDFLSILPNDERFSKAVQDLRGVLFKSEQLRLKVQECIDTEHKLDITINHGLDTDTRVCFYEQDFYVLSNFSSFTVEWKGIRFYTSEAAYHWEKFPSAPSVQEAIATAISAHQAFKIAEYNKAVRRPDWDEVKADIMRDILRAKVSQHEYVKRKLLATGDRELVENSWRDDFWGWGPNKDGRNQLGKLWMEIRSEING